MRIKAKAICVFKNQNKILLSKSYDPTVKAYFLRPIGGSIEFGETSLEAVQREIKEEIGAEIHNIKLLEVYENLFCFDGKDGHEIVFVYQADFVDSYFYQQEIIPAHESDGSVLHVSWMCHNQIIEHPLYPEGMCKLLDTI